MSAPGVPTPPARLHERFLASAEAWPERPAALDPARGTRASYAELRALAARARDALAALGVGPGERVGVAGKSLGSLATILGALEAGACYVPVDAHAPPARAASILADCGVRAFAAPPELGAHLAAELASDRPPQPLFDATLGAPLALHALSPSPAGGDAGTEPGGSERAYVLYTSGSTGKPKGVVHTHASALAFVDWCRAAFAPRPEDRFSSHAPFHFDLSILDLFVPLASGAAVVLLAEELGKSPQPLAETIAAERISVWYSTPSILRLLLEYGRMDPARYGALRLVLFAGEVFPLRHLRRLRELWRGPRWWNLYGPTETNVCTAFALPDEDDPEREEPYPIGRPCSADRARVVDAQGRDVAEGAEGELVVAGGSVMQGYWRLPERSAEAFLTDAGGTRWYRTGDLVRRDGAGELVFLGRRDRMIKRRGYRIEPGEVEAALYRHPEVSEAAVVDVAGEDGTTITAWLATRGGERLSLVALKRWCAENLPAYMVPDRFAFLAELPKTSTDKIDHAALRSLEPGG